MLRAVTWCLVCCSRHARVLFAALLCAAIAVALGVSTGLVSGYFGGKLDSATQWVASLVMALPGIVVMLAAATVLGHTVWIAMSIFGVLMAPGFYRLVNVTVKGVRNELYVDAARVSGLRDRRIISRHILSVVHAPIIIQIGIVISISIAIQAGLSLLGLGDMNTPTWGGMLSEGYAALFRQPWLILWPALLIGLTCLCLALLANAVRDELERSGPKVGRAAQSAAARDVPLAKTIETIVHPIPERSEEPLLRVRDLEIGYPDGKGGYLSVVHDVNLDVHQGEVLGLIGESGSGKSQTAFAVLGLLPDGGRVRPDRSTSTAVRLDHGADDKAVTASAAAHRVHPAGADEQPRPVVHDRQPARRADARRASASRRTRPRRRPSRCWSGSASRTRSARFNAYPHEVSGGMAQRVLIAGAVSANPDLIIADEPTTALDVTVQAEVLDLLRDLQTRARHGARLLVTHNFGVVADLCDRVTVMQYGRIVETGPVRDIFRNAAAPVHAVAARTRSSTSAPPARRVRRTAADHSREVAHEHGCSTVRNRRRDLPRQGIPRQAVPGPARASRSTSSPARPSAWSASPGRARPRSVAASSVSLRSPAGRSRSTARHRALPPRRAPRAQRARSRWSSRTPTRRSTRR